MIRTSRNPARTPSPKSSPRDAAATAQAAEALAIEALGFVAADPDLLQRFLAVTGIEAHAIRAAAREPGFMAGVLNFVAAHEPTLLAFAAASGRPPQAAATAVAAALAALPAGDARYDRSI